VFRKNTTLYIIDKTQQYRKSTTVPIKQKITKYNNTGKTQQYTQNTTIQIKHNSRKNTTLHDLIDF
jgi:hypothetical protein